MTAAPSHWALCRQPGRQEGDAEWGGHNSDGATKQGDSEAHRHGRAVVADHLEPSVRALLHQGGGYVIDPACVLADPQDPEINLGVGSRRVGGNGEDN